MACNRVPLDEMFIEAMSVLGCTAVPEPAHTVELNLKEGTIKVTYDSGPRYEGNITTMASNEFGESYIEFEVTDPTFRGTVVCRDIPFQLSSKLAYV